MPQAKAPLKLVACSAPSRNIHSTPSITCRLSQASLSLPSACFT